MALETFTTISSLVATNPTGGDPKSQGDDQLRGIKTVLLNSFAGFPGVVSCTGVESGTGDAYQVTVAPAPAVYAVAMGVQFISTRTNVAAPTLQVNALGAKAVVGVDGQALTAGDIEAGAVVSVFYNGTSFVLMSGNDRGARDGDVWTGTHDFTGAVQRVATLSPGDNSTNSANTAYADAAVLVEKTRALTAEALLAPLASPALTGVPTVPTQALNDNSTQIVNSAWVNQRAFATALPAISAATAGMFAGNDGVNAFWAYAGLNGRFLKSGNYTTLTVDRESLLLWTGAATVTLQLASLAGPRGCIYIGNASTADLTIQRGGSDTVDGLTSYVIAPNEIRLFFSDGASAWNSVIVRPYSITKTASGTLNVGPGYTGHEGDLWSGAAAGWSGAGSGVLYGSGGGGRKHVYYTAAEFGLSQALVIGAGGAPVAGNPGNAGGNSTLCGVTVLGGAPGTAGTGGGIGGGGQYGVNGADLGGLGGGQGAGTVSSGNSSFNGGGGGGGADATTAVGNGGSSEWGGGGSGAAKTGVVTAAGTSVKAGAAGATVSTGTAGNGVAPAGAGGVSFNGTGGSGARGELRLRGVC